MLQQSLDGVARGEQLVSDIYANYQASADNRRSRRLGYSWIGKECEREIWYTYRWCDEPETLEGRMYRLFETGQLEEERFVTDLRRVGASVYDTDHKNPNEQISVSTLDGKHFGFLDGVATNLAAYSSAPYLATEMKTHSEKSFKDLKKKGLLGAKPEHYAQLQGYMRDIKADEGLYIAKNKNTDELYCEFVPYDNVYASRLLDKAKRIIGANEPPARISNKADFFKCRFCKANAVCHLMATPPRNCRTCTNSTPLEGSKWRCEATGVVMDAMQQENMLPCDGARHRFLPGLVPGDVKKLENEVVTYSLASGEWKDDGYAGFPSDT